MWIEPRTKTVMVDPMTGLRMVFEGTKRGSNVKALTSKISDIEKKEVQWLWPGMIPRGKLVILCGDPGLGKSFMTLDICARLSTGRAFPFEEVQECKESGLPRDPYSCILLSAEDDPADTIRPRLEAMGADLEKVHVFEGIANREGVTISDFVIGQHSRELADLLDNTPGVGMVVIDPVSAYVGATDSYNNAQVRSMLKPLSDIAADYNVAVVLVTHMRKSEAQKMVHAAMGSLAFAAAARIVLMVSRNPNDEETRLLMTIKSNLSSDRVGYSYKVENGKVEWVEVLEGQADEIMQGAKRINPADAKEYRTVQAIKDAIDKNGGSISSAKAKEIIKMHGDISWTKFSGAEWKKKHGLGARKEGGPGTPWSIIKLNS